MTEAEREALLERMGILEYDAGLDHREAALTAFRFYYPEDYEKIMNMTAGNPARETYLYDWLEELITPSQSNEKGSFLNEEPKKVIYNQTAPDAPLRSQETKSGAGKRNGLEGLIAYVNKRRPA